MNVNKLNKPELKMYLLGCMKELTLVSLLLKTPQTDPKYEVISALMRGSKIQAIKSLKEISPMGLKEAKDEVERVFDFDTLSFKVEKWTVNKRQLFPVEPKKEILFVFNELRKYIETLKNDKDDAERQAATMSWKHNQAVAKLEEAEKDIKMLNSEKKSFDETVAEVEQYYQKHFKELHLEEKLELEYKIECLKTEIANLQTTVRTIMGLS